MRYWVYPTIRVNPGSLELLGTPSTAFSGVLIARETDDATGNINSVEAISGSFDANGILSLSVADLENPSFDLILVDAFTGSAGVDTINSLADLTALGTTTVFDAIGIIDTAGDGANSIAATLGGTLIAYTGDEPQTVFRDSANPSTLIAINDPAGTDAFDQNGNTISLATGFADAGGTPIDLTAGPFTTFGTANYQVIGGVDPMGSCSGLTPAPACIETTQPDCTTLGGTFVEGGNCPTGACDDGMGGCTIETEEACLNAGGTYDGNGTTCPQSGSCSGLTPAPACIQTTDVDCTSLGGVFTVDGMCPTGACTTDGLCGIATEEDCLNGGGTYDGDGTMCPGLMSDVLINEFEPNPVGADPAMVSFEILGPPSMAFNGVLLSVDTDFAPGSTIDRVATISGAFDANGILSVMIPDFENPSFALFLVDTYTGPTDGTGILDSADDLATLGITTVYDAISISDVTGDIANSIAGGIGGLDYPFTGDEPQLVFRDGVDPTIVYAINDPAGTDAQDQFDNLYDLATAFTLVDGTPVDLSTPTATFGAQNYTTLVADPTGACSGLAGAPACVQETEANCMTLGGVFASGETCPTGACNLLDLTCVITTEESCLDQGGTYVGDDTACTGACCDLLANQCTPNLTQASCDATGGQYLGDNSDCSGGCPTLPMGVVINEIRLDQPGADGEYLELAGPAGTSLSGLQVLIVGDPASGNVDRVIDLAGQSIAPDGIFLIADSMNTNVLANDGIDLDVPGFSIENGDNLTFFLVFGFSGSSGDDLDGDDDCLIDMPEPWIAELDRVALIVAQNSELNGIECHYATMPGMGGGGAGCPDCAGDFDNSGVRDFADITGFVDALLNTGDACADINADTFTNGLDIDPFITLVTSLAACPGGSTAEDIPELIVGPDGNFAPAHAFRFPNETGAWQQGDFDPADSFDTPGSPNTLPSGACCITMGCVETNFVDCAAQDGVFRGANTFCATPGICDPVGISTVQGGDAGVGFIVGPVTVVELVDFDGASEDDRSFTVQDESGANIAPAGTTRGLTVIFDELANPAIATAVDMLSEGNCVNLTGTLEDVGGANALRIDAASDISSTTGCAPINVVDVVATDFDNSVATNAVLESVRVRIDCVLVSDNPAADDGLFEAFTSYTASDGFTTISVRVNTVPNGMPTIIGAMIPEDAVTLEGVYSTEFGTRLRLHEADDLLPTTCFGSIGSCCLNDLSCIEVSPQLCDEANGTFSFGSTCAMTTCIEDTGACCVEGVCSESVALSACQMMGGLFLGDMSTCPAQCPSQDSLQITEVRLNQSGFPDADEYVEISGAPGTPLTGVWLLIIGDADPDDFNDPTPSPDDSGIVELALDLSNEVIPADGYWVAAEGTLTNAGPAAGGVDLTTPLNLEENENKTYLLVRDFSGVLGDDLDTLPSDDNGTEDCILDSQPWGTEFDRIAVIVNDNGPSGPGGSPGRCHYGPPTVGPDGPFLPAHVYRCDSDPMGPWLVGAFGNFDNDTPGGPNPCGPTGACCDESTNDCDEITEADCTSMFPGRTWQGADTTCANDCAASFTALVPCTDGVDCTNGDVNGYCIYQVDQQSSITMNGCGSNFLFSFEVGCPGSCSQIGTSGVFQIPADAFGFGNPVADCVVEAVLIDDLGDPGDLDNCDPTQFNPTFEVAP